MGALVKAELATRSEGVGSFKALCHHFSVQLRCSFPSAFDCRLGHALGVAAATHAIGAGKPLPAAVATLLAIRGTPGPAKKWTLETVALTDSALVSLPRSARGSAPLAAWNSVKSQVAMRETYRNPGPVQLPSAVEETAEWINLSSQLAARRGGGGPLGTVALGALAVAALAALAGGWWWSTQKKGEKAEKKCCH